MTVKSRGIEVSMKKGTCKIELNKDIPPTQMFPMDDFC